jgi:hypothetical protein
LVNSSTTVIGVMLVNQSSSTATQALIVENSEITGFPGTNNEYHGGEIMIFGIGPNGSGPLNNVQILNNVLHGASATSTDGPGVAGYGNGENLTNVLVQGNTVYNMGMFASQTNGGITAAGWNGGTVAHNVLHDIGANVSSCGGTSGIEAANSNNVTIQYNEVYNVRQTNASGGCDWDGIDLDLGTTNSLVQYNYTHNNGGTGYLAYTYTNGNAWGPNTYRYNVSENDGGAFALAYAPPQNALQVYGNTFLNNYSGSACMGFNPWSYGKAKPARYP